MKQPEYVKSMGNYNNLPDPIRPSDIHEFLHVYGHSTPIEEEFRQIMGKDKDFLGGNKKYSYIPVKILWFGTQAFLMTMPMDWDIDRGESGKESKIVYHDLPRYFKVGCDHQFNELSQKESREIGVYHGGSCYHVIKCTKCGLVDAYDSSD